MSKDNESESYELSRLKRKVDLLKVLLTSIEDISRSSQWHSEHSRRRVERLAHSGSCLVEILDELIAQGQLSERKENQSPDLDGSNSS